MKGLIEIFDRKEKEENKLALLFKEQRTEEKEVEIGDQKFLIESLNKQLCEEITNFKLNRENDLLLILKKFFKDKAECNRDISHIFDINVK